MNNAPFTDEEVLDELLTTFPPALETKFREGMKKYASPLTAKNCLDEAFPEVMDLVVYLTAERMKQQLLFGHLLAANQFLYTGCPVEAQQQVQAAIELIKPRPLAVKTKVALYDNVGNVIAETSVTSPSPQPASNA